MKITFGINGIPHQSNEYHETGKKLIEFFKQFPEIEIATQFIYEDERYSKYSTYYWTIDTQFIRKIKILNLQKELTEPQKELVRLLGDETKIQMNVSFSGSSGTTGYSGSSGTHGSSGTSGSSGLDLNLKPKVEIKPLPVVETKPVGEVKIVEPVEVIIGNPFVEILAEME